MTATQQQETAARQTLRGDWDAAGTTSAHLPRAAAIALLEARGWTQDAGYAWTSPHGTEVWETEEALQIALLAETVAPEAAAAATAAGPWEIVDETDDDEPAGSSYGANEAEALDRFNQDALEGEGTLQEDPLGPAIVLGDAIFRARR